MPAQKVPGFTTLGDAANSAVETLALRLALRTAVNALKLTDGNLSALLRVKPDAVLGQWRAEVRKAIDVAKHTGEAA